MMRTLVLAFVSIALSSASFAAPPKKKTSSSYDSGSPLQTTDGYGAAGCGLGSMLFKENTGLMQILGATFNGTSGSQTFGISSGTSNCKTDGFTKVDRNEIYFAEANFRDLSTQLAQGEGEHLAAFAQVLGCKDGMAAEFGSMTRSNYSTILPNSETTAVEMLTNVKAQMQSHPVLSKECRPLS